MVGASVTFNGVENVVSMLDRIKQAVIQFVTDEAKQIGDDLVSDMQSAAPVDTGFLRDNIEVSNSNNNAVQVSSRADYSIYVEMGTRYMAAQPFFYPAVNKINVEKIQQDFRSKVSL